MRYDQGNPASFHVKQKKRPREGGPWDAFSCDKSKNLALIHLYSLTWCKILCNHDHRLGCFKLSISMAGKHTYQTV